MGDFVSEVTADGPILWLWMDEIDGSLTAHDSSGFDRHFTVQGDLSWGHPSLAPGLPGKSVNMLDTGLLFRRPAAYWMGPSDMSAEVWFRQDDPFYSDYDLTNIFGLTIYNPPTPPAPDDNHGSGWSLGSHSGDGFGAAQGSWKVPGSSYSETINAVRYAKAHQLVITANATTHDVNLYVDGKLRITRTPDYPIENDLIPLVVGGRLDVDPGELHFNNGFVQHALLFDHPLTPERVYAHWFQGTGIGFTPPCHLYPRDDALGMGSGAIWPPPSSDRPGSYY